MKYIFILGHNPKLSIAEILAVLPQATIIEETASFLIVENKEFDGAEMLRRLGGTVKLGEIIGTQISKKVTVEHLKEIKAKTKLNFGLSYYDCKPDNLGMEIKKELKDSGVSCRLVTGKDQALSSVIVAKNKCEEFLILGKKWLGKTCAVQEFEDYSLRDYGRPRRDLKSGMMPPKLAKIMINLAQAPAGATILDPFCGSGTVIQEGLLLGHEMIGSDNSDKAISDTKSNLEWLRVNSRLEVINAKIYKTDVRQIAKTVGKVDAIVTEPYLGPALRGKEKIHEIKRIIEELSELYETAFSEFRKILNYNGRVVIIFPAFRVGSETLELPILEKIKKLGFTQVNKEKLIYSRPGQAVWRQIYVYQA